MSRILISEEAKLGIKGAKIIKPVYSEEYKILCEEANERILQERIREHEVYIRAKNFIAL